MQSMMRISMKQITDGKEVTVKATKIATRCARFCDTCDNSAKPGESIILDIRGTLTRFCPDCARSTAEQLLAAVNAPVAR